MAKSTKSVDLTSLPEWLHPGRGVMWVSPHGGYNGRGKFIRPTSVERVTERLIVLANGERFRRVDVRDRDGEVVRYTGGTYSRSMDFLWLPDDERLPALRDEIRLGRAWTEAEIAAGTIRRDAPIETVRKARDALTNLLAVLEEQGSK